ncbi:MAG: type II secretion system protein [Steroidobacteraceae bacterium]
MRAAGPQAGFTYLGLLLAVAIIGLLLTVASRVWSISAQRDKEAELLYAGDQYRRAIAGYYAFGHHYPLTLDDLLVDKRYPVPRHYLRQRYRDPFTGQADWALIPDPTGVGIMGVASQSKGVPIKRKGFGQFEVSFADQDCYCNWKFVYLPPRWYPRQNPSLPPLQQPPSAQPAPGQ